MIGAVVAVWLAAAGHREAVAEDLLFDSFELACVDRDGATVHVETVDGRRVDELGRVELLTDLEFIEGPALFSGVPLSALAALCETVGLDPRKAVASALNDYVATVPAADWTRYEVLVADRMNGEPMPIAEKGPFWIIYPVSDHPQLDRNRYNERMVWQLSRLEFQESE